MKHQTPSSTGLAPLIGGSRVRAELAAMIRHIVRTYPHAATIAGSSWGYNLESYRRLFRAAYVASRALPTRAVLHGSASWGQFLRHDGALKTDLALELTRKLPSLDIDRPWLAFPLPMLVTSAPVAEFVRGAGPNASR